MDETEKSIDSPVVQESLFNSPKEKLSSTHITDSSQSPADEEKSLAKHVLDTITHQDHSGAELYCSSTEVNSADHSEEVISDVQQNSDECPEISDHSVPCTQSSLSVSVLSPVAALVPTTTNSLTIQQVLEQTLPEDETPISSIEVSNLIDSPSIGCQIMDYTSEKDSNNNYSFAVSEDDSYHALTDDDSCDASYLQSVRDSADAFNQQYREKRADEESSLLAEPFSPEAFFSSIPLFNKLQKRPAMILPKLYSTDSSSDYQYEQANQCFTLEDHGVIMSNSKPSSTLLMHSSSQGVPIAPKPDPNAKVSCYVLVVPAPVYYENFTAQDSLQVQQQHPEDLPETSPTEAHLAVTKTNAIPEALHPILMLPPEWTPQLQKPARTPLPSTRIRVSPSPNRGSRSSPLITVSTTSTPIQPLQGNRQQYVIVQGNNRHLKGIARYKDSFRTPTVEENHQPIYLQGLPPQGFRRFWKSKEGSCERTTKRSLAPLFSKVSPSDGQEATVPQTAKSPLTCIRSKLPCDREVPETDSTGGGDSKLLANENTNASTLTPTEEKAESQITPADTIQECNKENELEVLLDSKKNKRDEITTTPTPKTRHGEDREKKKIRDRRYDAELKKAFDQLRQLVPRLQKSSSRGLVLQETIKYIGILEQKVLGAGLWSTLQSVETAERSTRLENATQGTNVDKTQGAPETSSPSVISCDITDFSNVAANTEKEPLTIPEQEKSTTVSKSPLILIPPMSLTTEELSYSFVSHEGSVVAIDSVDTNEEGVTVEEVPLSLPFQQVQLLAVDQRGKNPVLTPRSPDEPQSKEAHTKLIPVVEIPGYTESGEYLNEVDEAHMSPQWDVLLSAMTTISQEGLNDLGVTLSPLLSPLGILLSPGEDRCQEPTITAVVEGEESAEAEETFSNSGTEDDSFASSVGMSGICTDMMSIAASVEITTEERVKSVSLSTGKTRKKLRPAQIVPSVSPLQDSDDGLTSGAPRRAILQDHSNFTDAKSSGTDKGKGRQRRLKDHSPNDNADENCAIVANQSRTPPGRVSGVLLTGKRKNSRSPRGGVGTKRGRRL